MNIQVNTATAVEAISNFVTACGGTFKHSDVLELVAQMGGMKNYRALKAAEKKAKHDKEQAAAKIASNPRSLENASSLVHRSIAMDWRFSEQHDQVRKDIPEEHHGKYVVALEACGDQFRVLVSPENTDIDTFEGKPVLDILVEINEGLPCAHITNDPAGEMLMSVFATGHGLVVRPDDAELIGVHSLSAPAELKRVAGEVTSASELSNTFVAPHDTAEKYREM